MKRKTVHVLAAVIVILCAFAAVHWAGFLKTSAPLDLRDPMVGAAWYFLAKGIFAATSLVLLYEIKKKL